MNHGVFVATQITRKLLVLLERLSHAHEIDLAHNSASACEKRTLDSIWLDILSCQKLDGLLRRRNLTCGRQKPPPRRRLIPSIIGIRNASKKIPERFVPLRRQALEVQLQRELDFAGIARSARIGT